MKHLRRFVALAAILLASCQGPDLVRIQSERANWALATRCADGWFQSLPFDVDDERIVRDALADWDEALKADEALLGWPLGGSR